jgi:hypothetical protein
MKPREIVIDGILLGAEYVDVLRRYVDEEYPKADEETKLRLFEYLARLDVADLKAERPT